MTLFLEGGARPLFVVIPACPESFSHKAGIKKDSGQAGMTRGGEGDSGKILYHQDKR